MTKHKLVLIRHGLSDWNLQNRFTGWQNVDLAEEGVIEAHQGGKALREAGFSFDMVHTSVLKRAIRTQWIVLDELDQMHLPVQRSYKLNERHYGALTGLNKSETALKHGEDQVLIWRRSLDVPPPPMQDDDPRLSKNDVLYQGIDSKYLPKAECLRDTIVRVSEYWHDSLAPDIKAGKKVLVVAHGNSLRALVKYLDNISDAEIMDLNIPTGIPLVYELDTDLKPLRHYYLADEKTLASALQSVAHQGKASVAS